MRRGGMGVFVCVCMYICRGMETERKRGMVLKSGDATIFT